MKADTISPEAAAVPLTTPALAGKRIVVVLGTLLLGGAERQAIHLALHLKNREGASVQVWGLSGAEGAEPYERLGIPWKVIRLNWGAGRVSRLGQLLRFAWLLRRTEPDILLPYCSLPNVACGLVWRLTGASVCIWSQRDSGKAWQGVGLGTSKAERRAARNVPLLVSNSQAGADFLTHTLGAAADRIRIVYNGVELPEVQATRAAWRTRLGVDDECFLACMVAHIHANKDHPTLLKAWRAVVGKMGRLGNNAVLLLAGREYPGSAMRALADSLSLSANVQFLGEVKDIAGLLGAIDLCVFSSHHEGTPNGVLECMAAGLAVAATDITGIREAVGPQGYPYLAAPEDPDALADRILLLAQDERLRLAAGAANRERVRAEFTVEAMCRTTVSAISEVLARHWRPTSRR